MVKAWKGFTMLTMQPIGYVRSPFNSTQDVPKDWVRSMRRKEFFEIREEFEEGLRDIEGFSHRSRTVRSLSCALRSLRKSTRAVTLVSKGSLS
jgi:hypothetical protein